MRAHATGDRVTQSKYGSGTVTEANAQHTVIDFDEHGLRRFVTDMVRLEPSATPAPQRASTRAKRAAKPKTT